MTQTKESMALGPRLPKGRSPAALQELTSAYLDSGSPGVITFHVQEFIHIDLQLWDLLLLGQGWEEAQTGASARRGCGEDSLPNSKADQPSLPSKDSCSGKENRSGLCQGKLPNEGELPVPASGHQGRQTDRAGDLGL